MNKSVIEYTLLEHLKSAEDKKVKAEKLRKPDNTAMPTETDEGKGEGDD